MQILNAVISKIAFVIVSSEFFYGVWALIKPDIKTKWFFLFSCPFTWNSRLEWVRWGSEIYEWKYLRLFFMISSNKFMDLIKLLMDLIFMKETLCTLSVARMSRFECKVVHALSYTQFSMKKVLVFQFHFTIFSLSDDENNYRRDSFIQNSSSTENSSLNVIVLFGPTRMSCSCLLGRCQCRCGGWEDFNRVFREIVELQETLSACFLLLTLKVT